MAKQTIQTIGGERREVKVKKKTPLYVWISIVVVLVAAGVIAAVVVPPQRRLTKAEHDIDQLVLALNGFARENGRYPRGTTAEIAKLLLGEEVKGQNPKHLDYIEAKSYEMNSTGEFIDPWGSPYHISCDGGPRIYSDGPNRVDEFGQGDDITSWREK